MLYKPESGIDFTQSGGYIFYTPNNFIQDPLISSSYSNTPLTNFKPLLISLCKQIPKLDHPANYRLRSRIIACLQQGWDPSMMAGRLAGEGFNLVICAETIYEWLYNSGYAIAEKLYQYLRQGKKRRTIHKGRSAQKSKIPNRLSIHERPSIVDEKARLGEWGEAVLFIPTNTPLTLLMGGLVVWWIYQAYSKASRTNSRSCYCQIKPLHCLHYYF